MEGQSHLYLMHKARDCKKTARQELCEMVMCSAPDTRGATC